MIVMYVCWVAGFYLAFRNNYKEFSSYKNSLFSLLNWKIPDSNSVSWEE